MPLRERLRKTFSRGSSISGVASEPSSLSPTITNSSTIEGRKGSHIYQPGERMPPMKYRRPVAKEHKEHLEAFDFSTAWRRVSRHSIYSPHGSRMPSRNPSVVSGPPGVSRTPSLVPDVAGRDGAPDFDDSSAGEETPSEERSNASSSDVTGSTAATELSSSLQSWTFRERE